MRTEILKLEYQAEVIGPSGLLFTVDANTPDALIHEVGGILSQLTMEEGVLLPQELSARVFVIKRFAGVIVSRRETEEIRIT